MEGEEQSESNSAVGQQPMDINDMNLGQNDISMIMHEQSDMNEENEGDPNEDTGLLAKELVFAKKNIKKTNLN